jgi:Family of unknown function (DUF5397)
MTGSGFQEEQSQFMPASSAVFVGQVRRFGAFGPAYEVVGAASADEVAITVVESGERLTYAVADVLADPIAETIP